MSFSAVFKKIQNQQGGEEAQVTSLLLKKKNFSKENQIFLSPRFSPISKSSRGVREQRENLGAPRSRDWCGGADRAWEPPQPGRGGRAVRAEEALASGNTRGAAPGAANGGPGVGRAGRGGGAGRSAVIAGLSCGKPGRCREPGEEKLRPSPAPEAWGGIRVVSWKLSRQVNSRGSGLLLVGRGGSREDGSGVLGARRKVCRKVSRPRGPCSGHTRELPRGSARACSAGRPGPWVWRLWGAIGAFPSPAGPLGELKRFWAPGRAAAAARWKEVSGITTRLFPL